MVREIRRDELNELLELYLHLHEERVPDCDCNLKATWDEITNDRNHHIIVNEIDGRIVASCVLVIVPNLTRGIRPYALIENVVTHSDYRKRGYGTQCLEYACAMAQESNCYKVMLLTGSKEKSTLDFYSKAGFSCDDKTAFVRRL